MSLRSLSVLVVLALGASVALTGCQQDLGSKASTSPSSSTPTPAATSAPAAGSASLDRRFAALERSHDATLGLSAVDTGSGRSIGYRAATRFPFASSNKVFIAATVLSRSSAADLDTVVHYSRADLLAYAPVTTVSVDRGMTVRALLDAMLRFSDNTAANLLVARVGGPSVVQQWLRGAGDRTTNVDRTEPTLNEALPGDARDTTTPAQSATNLRKVLLGADGGQPLLDTADRTLLRNLMLGCTTGDDTIRAGVDPAWPVADKTGTGEYGVRDDIAVVYPIGRAPIIVTVMSRKSGADDQPDDALLAAATKLAVGQLTR